MHQRGQVRQQLTPRQAMAKGLRLTAAGRLAEAEAIYRQILKANPAFSPAYFELGVIAVHCSKLPLAAELMAQAAKLDPASASYQRSLCEVYRRLRKLPEAIESGKRAVQLAPQDPEARYNLGLALSDAGDMKGAVVQYREALNCSPGHGLAANNLGAALERLGDEKGAEDAYVRAVTINPRHAEAQNNLGAILSARGDLDQAKACFPAAIEADPAFVHAHYNLSTLKKYTPDDPHLKALENIAQRSGAMPPDVRMRFCFAIAKAREDVGRYDDAFAAYAMGNKLKRATFTYDEKKTAENIRAISIKYDEAFAKKKIKGCADDTPIFIVGMPRSGTTLIEQIISSHSGVHGAGELHDFSQAVAEVTGAPIDGNYMDWLLKADGELLQRIGENYVARLKAKAPRATRITDKMPGNFYYTGLIHKVLPKAKIIHAVRDPMDICFSNYSRLFNETMVFAYDLGELGRYYRNYRRMMDYWKKVLPKDAVLDVVYEDLVSDQKGQSRRILDYCGLDWEDRCLDFHKNDRPVKTASIAQVRKPIYKTSVKRWERFARHLGPLRAAIEGEGETT